jgi:phospholipid/cholesterol/gamma-HCH transport system ATP-binding protein
VGENVALPLQLHSGYSNAEIADLVAFKLALVGLGSAAGVYPSEVSGGMRKRAALARSLALDPQILFLDEPSAGLDPISSRKLDDLILELRDALAVTIVVVTHELASIFAIADDSVFLDADSKTAIAHGDPKLLRQHSDVSTVRAFLTRSTVSQPTSERRP